MSHYKTLLVLPHLIIHNANALSSPFTIGFPAMTAWLGATHALERRLNAKGLNIACQATGVISHSMNLQTYKGTNDFVHSIVGTGNPLDKQGKRQAFIEEARCHLDVSLIIEISGIPQKEHQNLVEEVSHLLQTQIKMAGGHIQTFNEPFICVIEEGNDKERLWLVRRLMPGYALIERRDLMIEAMEQGQDALDALIDYLAIHHECQQDGEKITWHSFRKSQNDKSPGWIVPIATGFHAISEPTTAKNQRDPEIPHRFAESIVTLGEFKMIYRFDSITDILWQYQANLENNLYQCIQSKTQTTTASTSEEFVE